MENCFEYDLPAQRKYDLPAQRTQEDDLASGILLTVIMLAILSAIFAINIETDFAMNSEGQIQQDASVQVAE